MCKWYSFSKYYKGGVEIDQHAILQFGRRVRVYMYVLFEELGRHANRGESQECPNCGVCKDSVEPVLFECTFPETNFLDCLKQVFLPDAFEAFLHSSIFDKAVFCLGEKQGMLVNDECSSWYNTVGDVFIVSLR